jgi:menaquinone-dependent protoporphyrinogen oxidase
MIHVLIVHGSRGGATADIAEALAVAFTDRGITADVRAADTPVELDRYDAVVVGSALYAGHWLATTRRFVEAHREELRHKPTWLFSSGPLDDSATDHEIPPVAGVARLAADVGAHGHVTFGGRLDVIHAHGFLARMMARTRSGDWRDHEQIVRWADEIADRLISRRHHPSVVDDVEDSVDTAR